MPRWRRRWSRLPAKSAVWSRPGGAQPSDLSSPQDSTGKAPGVESARMSQFCEQGGVCAAKWGGASDPIGLTIFAMPRDTLGRRLRRIHS